MNWSKYLTVLLSFFIQTIYSQEHLTPTPGFLNGHEFYAKYHPKLREILLSTPNFPKARVLIMPSFTGEKVLELVMDESGNYLLELREATPSVHSVLTNDRIKIKVSVAKREITAVKAELILHLFKKLMRGVKYPQDDRLGTDGTGYYFMFGNKSGMTWSPRTNSKMGRLVELTNELIAFCTDDKITFDDSMSQQIENLIGELE